MAENTKATVLKALKDLNDSLDHLRKLVVVRAGAPASPKPTAYSPKPAGPSVRTPSSAVPSPVMPVIAPRPQVNPNAPMSRENAITLEAKALVMATRYNRPQNDLAKALAATVKDRAPKVGFQAAMMEAEQGLVWRLDRGLM